MFCFLSKHEWKKSKRCLCKCFSNFSEKPWLKLFEGHEMAFFYAAKVLLSLYEKKKKFSVRNFFYTYFAKWFFLSELFLQVPMRACLVLLCAEWYTVVNKKRYCS